MILGAICESNDWNGRRRLRRDGPRAAPGPAGSGDEPVPARASLLDVRLECLPPHQEATSPAPRSPSSPIHGPSLDEILVDDLVHGLAVEAQPNHDLLHGQETRPPPPRKRGVEDAVEESLGFI